MQHENLDSLKETLYCGVDGIHSLERTCLKLFKTCGVTMKSLAKSNLSRTLLRGLATTFCVLCFCYNSFHTIMSFQLGDKITSISLRPVQDEVMDYPAIAVCSARGFKDPKQHMVTLEDYRNNTYDPDDFICGVTFADTYSVMFWDPRAHNNGSEKVRCTFQVVPAFCTKTQAL